MSEQSLLEVLLAGSLLLAIVLGVGLLLPRLVRLSEPRVCLRYWHCLLAGSLLLLPMWLLWPPVSSNSAPGVVEVVFAETIDVLGTTGPPTWPLSRVLLLLIGGGVLVRLTWVTFGAFLLRRLHRRAQSLSPIPDPLLAAQRAVGSTARFLTSGGVTTPMMFGVLRPTVLLPTGFSSLPTMGQTAVACHELLHVARRDWPKALIEEALRALFWFHPMVWLVLGRLALSREQVVDSEVVRLTGSRRAYLDALLTIAKASHDRRSVAAAAMPFLRCQDLKQRVLALSKEVRMSRIRRAMTLLTMTAVLLATAAAVLTSVPAVALAGQEEAENEEGKKAEDSIHFVRDGVERPVKLSDVQPQYTDLARKERTQGAIILQTVIEKDGTISRVQVLQGLPNGLNEASVEAVKQWRYEPATLDGEPVRVYFNLTINFVLRKE